LFISPQYQGQSCNLLADLSSAGVPKEGGRADLGGTAN